MSEDNWRSVTRYITNKNHYLLINYRDSCSFAGVSVISFDVVSPMDIMLPACLVEVSAIIPPVGIFCSYFPPYLHYKQHCSHFWFFIFYYSEGDNPRKLKASCCGAASGGVRAVEAESNGPEFVSWESPLGFSGCESSSWNLESWFACKLTLVHFTYIVNVICLIYVVRAEYLHCWILLNLPSEQRRAT